VAAVPARGVGARRRPEALSSRFKQRLANAEDNSDSRAADQGRVDSVGTYEIREAGHAAEVEVHDDCIVRTVRDASGHADVETIPMDAVAGVSHQRKRLATDEVTLQVGLVAYKWQTKRAEDMLAEVHRIRFITRDQLRANADLGQ
jgi:hypothetical protein